MGVIKVPTTFNIDLEFEIPEFHRRLFAWAIDIVFIYIYCRVAIAILSRSISSADVFSKDGLYNIWGLWMMILIPVFVYHLVCEISMNGQSIGKKIMGIKVVSENGGRPGISQFIIRWLIRTSDYIYVAIIYTADYLPDKTIVLILLAIYAPLTIIDIILVVSSKKGQRLGDILAHTILVSTKPRGSMEETIFMEVADNYVPVFPQIMKLSDKDINAIKSILDTARKKGDFNLAAMASEKIKSHLKIDSPMSPFDFLDTLLKDYNYLSVK
ncbi:MAG TPA: RDD family protein [Chitinophagaceae bacterium]|jgi:uncharacterized RDD family membrane protein YckC|nr:RDD family protein [Chitinophagaceae bacterium]